MKKIILFVVLSIFLASPCLADKGVSGKGYGRGVAAAGGATYDHYVQCDDDAANTVVSNDSDTGKGDWVAGKNTNIVQTDDPEVGNGSFLLNDVSEFISSAENWTDETFTVTFYFKPNSITPAAPRILFIIGDVDSSTEENEFMVTQITESDELILSGRGDGGEYQSAETSGLNLTTDWQEIEIVLDASGATWTATVKKDGGADTLGAWTGNPSAAVFNSLLRLSYDGSTYAMTGKIRDVRISGN